MEVRGQNSASDKQKSVFDMFLQAEVAYKLWKIVDGIKDEMVKEQKDDIVDEMKDNGLWAKTAIQDTLKSHLFH